MAFIRNVAATVAAAIVAASKKAIHVGEQRMLTDNGKEAKNGTTPGYVGLFTGKGPSQLSQFEMPPQED